MMENSQYTVVSGDEIHIQRKLMRYLVSVPVQLFHNQEGFTIRTYIPNYK